MVRQYYVNDFSSFFHLRLLFFFSTPINECLFRDLCYLCLGIFHRPSSLLCFTFNRHVNWILTKFLKGFSPYFSFAPLDFVFFKVGEFLLCLHLFLNLNFVAFYDFWKDFYKLLERFKIIWRDFNIFCRDFSK